MIRVRILNLFHLSCKTHLLSKSSKIGIILGRRNLIFSNTETSNRKQHQERGKLKARKMSNIAVQSLAIKSKKIKKTENKG